MIIGHSIKFRKPLTCEQQIVLIGTVWSGHLKYGKFHMDIRWLAALLTMQLYF